MMLQPAPPITHSLVNELVRCVDFDHAVESGTKDVKWFQSAVF